MRIPSEVDGKYKSTWGSPGTFTRFRSMRDHLNMLAQQRAGRPSYHQAISEWVHDCGWLVHEFGDVAAKYREVGYV